MGLAQLRLVLPRFEGMHLHREARSLAAGADSVLESARTFESLAAALADRQLAVAVSAEAREFGPAIEAPEVACGALIDEGGTAALVFGPERTGLSVADVGLCQRLCSIPTDEQHSSLNLAQAVQVLAYELRRQCQRRVELGKSADSAACNGNGSPASAMPAYATHDEVEGFFNHLERSLVAIRYLDPSHPKKLMPRLRRLFGRTRLEIEEIHLLRGVCKLMLETASRNSGANLQSRPDPTNQPKAGSEPTL